MLELKQVKTILQVAGITQLKIQFNDNLEFVNAFYVFRGKPGSRQIAYQEIIDSLTIGSPSALAGSVPDGYVDIKDLPGENEDNGLKRT